MGPVGHLGIPLPVARLLKLNLVVTGLCALLPDIVDKPLWALGIGNGRYVAHTLLFVFLVAIVFSLKKKRYGLSAFFGGILHLLLDAGGFVPWRYPFARYQFPQEEFSFGKLFHSVFGLSGAGEELIWVVSIGLAVFLVLWLTTRLRKRSDHNTYHAGQSGAIGGEDDQE